MSESNDSYDDQITLSPSPPHSPDLSKVEERNSRLRDMILSGGKKESKKRRKTINDDDLEHVKFQREVAAGLYKPTEEEVEQLVLVPHFDHVHFHNFGEIPSPPKEPSQLRKQFQVPPGLTREQYDEICANARKRAEVIYKKNAKGTKLGTKAPRQLVTDETADDLLNDDDDLDNTVDAVLHDDSYEVLRRAVIQLSKEVQNIEGQNKILLAHLQLLDKAKQRLELEAQCSREAIQWEKNQIEEYYKEHPVKQKKRADKRRNQRKPKI